jgi:hypothetical protein
MTPRKKGSDAPGAEPAGEPTAEPATEPDEPAVDSGRHPATSGHGTSAPDACSVLWDADATSAFGTAARAAFFVVLEQPGPWGRVAARESHLEVGLGTELDARCAEAGGRFMLMRRPAGHPDHVEQHRVLIAHAGERPDDAWLIAADVKRPGDLLEMDWTALARGHRELVRAAFTGAKDAEPQLLVCTNGRRDVCCAVRGRPLAAAAAQAAPDRVWEVSHTGGHRFAPTAVLLPWGQTLARLDAQSAAWVLEASQTGHVPKELLGPLHDRGRSILPPGAQCAESHVRSLVSETRVGALWATPTAMAGESDAVVQVTHEDGRQWRVQVERRPAGVQRPESCGKSAIEVLEYVAQVIDGAPAQGDAAPS